MIKCLSHNQLKMIPKNVKNHSNCASGITSLKMRLGRGEGKFSLHSITNLGEFCYFNYQFYYLKDLSPPFIGARVGHDATKLVP